MSHNITVESGKSIRLLTSGKYCDRDIIVTATGGGSDDSIAYIVSSVDELNQINAVDGSIGIVKNDSLDGWWEFNSELTQPEGEIWIGFEVLDWDGNLYPMKKITQEERGDGFDLLYVRNSDEYETVFAYEYYEDEGGAWGFFAYRRIKVDTSINTPTTSQEQWFRKNAKKLKSLYIRENGEWVEVSYEMGSGESSSEDLEALGALCDWEVIINSGGPSLLAISNYHPSYYLHCRIDMFEGGTTQEQHSDIVVPPNSTVSIEVMLALTNGESRVEVNDVRWKASET